MEASVLLLNIDYQPLKVLPWQKAVCLVLADKVRIVETYADRAIHSASGLTFPWPAVVVLKQFARMSKRAEAKIRFKRANVHARDGYECCYCGSRPVTPSGLPDTSKLSLDHVIPKSQAKNGRVYLPWAKKDAPQTCWENVVTSCHGCNHLKADHTPEQAGMAMRYLPRPPNSFDVVRIILSRMAVPEEWEEYL